MHWRTVTDGPSAAAFARYRASVAGLHAAALPEGADAEAFVLDGRVFQLPGAFLHRVTASGHLLVREAALVAERPNDHVSLFRLDAGRVEADYGGSATVLNPGDLVWLDYGRPMASLASDFSATVAMVPRARAPRLLRDGKLHGAVLRARDGRARLVSGFVDALFSTVADLDLAEAEAALDGLLLAAARPFREAACAPEADDPAGSTVDRVRAFVLGRLADPDLSVASVVRFFGLTRSTLYRAFAGTDGVAALILSTRLDAALQALVSAPPHPRLVAEVRAAHGLPDAAHFARVFLARFGYSPSEVVAMRASGDPKAYRAWLTAQASLHGFSPIVARLGMEDAASPGYDTAP